MKKTWKNKLKQGTCISLAALMLISPNGVINVKAKDASTSISQNEEVTTTTESIIHNEQELKIKKSVSENETSVSVIYAGEFHTATIDNNILFLDGEKLDAESLYITEEFSSIPLASRVKSNIKWGNWSTSKKTLKIPNKHLSAIAAIIAALAPSASASKVASIASALIQGNYNYIEVIYKTRIGTSTEMLGKIQKQYTCSEQKITFYGKNKANSTPKYITTVSISRKRPN